MHARTTMPEPADSRAATARRMLALALLYFLASGFSWLTIHERGTVALFWPAAGIGLCGVLRFGRRYLAAIPLALVAFHLTIDPVPPVFLLASLLANTLGTLAGVAVADAAGYRRHVDARNALLVLAAGTATAVVSACIGVPGMVVSGILGHHPAGAAWTHWALGNLLGVAAAGPAILLVPSRRERRSPDARTAQEPERLAWMVVLVTSFLVMAWGAAVNRPYVLGLTSLPLAVLTWSALRLPAWWTALGTLATGLLIGSLAGFGLAGFAVPRQSLDVVHLLGFLIVVTVLPIVVAVVTHDRRALMRRLLRSATTDPVTGLANRTAFEHAVRARLATPDAPPRALAYIDLDHLKLVNDTASHQAGDALIRGIGGVVRGSAHEGDLVGHLGGDEFALLLHNVLPAEAEARARALLRAIAVHRCDWEGRSLGTTASIGLVPFHASGPDFAELLSQADAACFAAKDAGGDQVRLAGLGGGRLDATRQMRAALRTRQAVEAGGVLLFAQAIAPVAGGRGGGRHFEMLLRLRDPSNGEILLPGEFLPAAARFRLSPMIDREVLRLGLDWLERHADPDEVEMCSINLTAESLGDEALLGFLSERLRRTRFPLHKLCLEITETSALRDLARTQRFIGQMRALGCRFALDDFGTGFSSFGHLRSLDVDYFKIDGSFVRDMDTSPLSLAIVRSIIDIAHTLDRQSIAEHAENAAQLARLAVLGVDMAQGYAIHRPEPIDDYFARPWPATGPVSAVSAPPVAPTPP